MMKMVNPESMREVLPMFSHCDSLAVKYLIDEIFNRMQLSDP